MADEVMKIFNVIFFLISTLSSYEVAYAFGQKPADFDEYCYENVFFFNDPYRDHSYYNCKKLRKKPVIPVSDSCGVEAIYPGFSGKYFGEIQTIAPRFLYEMDERRHVAYLKDREDYPDYNNLIIHESYYPKNKGVLKIVDEVNLEADVLGSTYCHQKNPTNAEQAFSPGFDIPANFIDYWRPEYIKFKWENKLANLISDYPNIDLMTAYELNLRSAQLWRELVICEGGAEQARNTIALDQWSCSELRKKYTDLQLGVGGYLMTFNGLEKEKRMSIDADMIRGGQIPHMGSPALNAALEAVRYGRIRLPAVHPLFTHFLFGYMLSDAFELHNDNEERSRRGALQLLKMLPRKDCLPIGLWPSNVAGANRALIKNLTKSSGARFKDTGVIQIECTGEILPEFYVKEDQGLYNQYLKIYRRYMR